MEQIKYLIYSDVEEFGIITTVYVKRVGECLVDFVTKSSDATIYQTLDEAEKELNRLESHNCDEPFFIAGFVNGRWV